MKNKKFWWLLVILWCGLIFMITESPRFTGENTKKAISSTVEKTSLAVAIDTPSTINKLNFSFRKSGHFIGFGVLALLLWKALPTLSYSLLLAWLLATAYAATDEWHQSFVSNRTASVNDVILDSLGAAVFLLVPVTSRILSNKLHRKFPSNRE